jgi:dimethylamine monooxygenase subunit A
VTPLPPPARYLPFLGGKYSVTPDLAPLDRDFGNGPQDKKLFQFDTECERYRASTRNAIATHPERHVLFDDFPDEVAEAVVALMTAQLQSEWPELPQPAPKFHALCEYIQEDIAVVRWTPERGEWNAALHITAPSHWAPEDKIGKGYADTHALVPGMERQRNNSHNLAKIMRTKGPFVRFTWGISFSDAINCHPKLPQPDFDADFDRSNLFIRAERQVIWPLPPLDTFLFAIRLYLYPLTSLSRLELDALQSALVSMSPESCAYKSIANHYAEIQKYLINY